MEAYIDEYSSEGEEEEDVQSTLYDDEDPEETEDQRAIQSWVIDHDYGNHTFNSKWVLSKSNPNSISQRFH